MASTLEGINFYYTATATATRLNFVIGNYKRDLIWFRYRNLQNKSF